jgi:hypothetical protein
MIKKFGTILTQDAAFIFVDGVLEWLHRYVAVFKFLQLHVTLHGAVANVENMLNASVRPNLTTRVPHPPLNLY